MHSAIDIIRKWTGLSTGLPSNGLQLISCSNRGNGIHHEKKNFASAIPKRFSKVDFQGSSLSQVPCQSRPSDCRAVV